jgi:hypothetical protein
MYRLSVLLTVLLATNTAAQVKMLTLSEYELRSAKQTIQAELARVRRAAETPDLSREAIEVINSYRSDLHAELERVQVFPRDTVYSTSIVRGVNTAQFPSVGALLHNAETVCSGTLIGHRSFLSARHCFETTTDPAKYAVYLQHAGILTVADISFPEQDELDLALLTLQDPVTGIAPSMVPDARTSTDQQRQIVGFGLSATGASDSGIKRYGGITTSACTEQDDRHICWKFDPLSGLSNLLANICYRDSGGPVGTDSDRLLQFEDAVAIGLTPGADCQSSPLNSGLAVLPHAVWVYSSVPPVEPPQSPELPDCCGDGVIIRVVEGQLPKQDGTAFDDWGFQVPDTVRVVRVALNAFDIPLSNLELSVRSVQSLPASPGCTDLGRYEACKYRFDDVPPKDWAAHVENPGGGDVFYQLVVTMFEPLNEE